MSAADLDAEGLLPIADLARTVTPRVHRSTVERWVTTGVKVRGPGGTVVVRLDAVRRGLGWLTTLAAYHRFLDAQTAAALGGEPEQPDRTPAKRRRQHAAAASELDAEWSKNRGDARVV